MHIKQNEKDSDSIKDKTSQMIKDEAKTKTVSPYRIVLEYVAVMTIIIVPLTVQAGVFKSEAKAKKEITEITSMTSETNASVETPVLSALQNPDPQGGRGGADVLVNDGVLVSAGPVSEDMISNTQSSSGEISIYTVREADTLSHIADMYGVTVNTILWANDLTKASSIREGQVLVILPIVGVRHDVKKNDTLSKIAKEYDGNEAEILAYNQLDSEDLVVGSTIVIPGGSMHTAPVVAKASPTNTSGSSGSWLSHPAPGSKRSQGIHGYNGVDLAAPVGTAIRAAAAGEVIVSKSSGWNGGYGRYIVIRHSNGTQTLYAHLSSNKVGVGAYVGQGQVIGGMGNTGKSTGSHLHFEVRGGSNPF